MAKRSSKRQSRQSALRGLSFPRRSKKSRSAKGWKSSSISFRRKTTKTRPAKKGRVLAIQWFPPRSATKAKLGKQFTIPLTRQKILVVSFFAPKDTTKGRPKKSRLHELVLPLKLQTAVVALMILAGVIGSVYFGLQVTRAQIPPPSAATSTTNTPPIPLNKINLPPKKGLGRSAPKRLRVPAIGVDTKFIELGKEADGTMEVPKEYHVAGWYKYAPTPGQIGPAVVVGHVDNYLGAAVFYRLRELKAGDLIIIERRDGKTVKFKVNSVKQFSQSAFPTKKVYGNLDYPGLRLITCGGQFSHTSGRYSHNTVVFASQVPKS